ncbi:MAG: hypothetical protein ACJ790_10975 [Myxococcaceae bacterium]
MDLVAPDRSTRLALLTCGICLCLGAALRLSFPDDIEYKADERFMFEAAQHVGRTEPWPTVGMPSGASLRNPPLSIWAFVVLARVVHADTPPELARVVAVLNLFALIAFALFAWFRLESEWRAPWLFALGLLAVNPAAVQLERKIWAQCLLPPLVAATLWAWSSRRRWAGAIGWGFVGALLGQIHMSGFFFAPALLIWTWLFDPLRKGVKWAGWFAGSVLGAIPLLPWLSAIGRGESGGASGFHPLEALFFRFYLYAFADPFGVLIRQSLGRESFAEFIRRPWVAVAFGGAVLALIVAAGLGIQWLWQQRRAMREKLRSEGSLLMGAVMLGYGVLLSASTLRIFRHYLIIALPLPFVLASSVLLLRRWGRWALLALIACELTLSVSFLLFIYDRGGAPDGDYGVSYARQK